MASRNAAFLPAGNCIRRSPRSIESSPAISIAALADRDIERAASRERSITDGEAKAIARRRTVIEEGLGAAARTAAPR